MAAFIALFGPDPEGPLQLQIRGGDLVSFWAGGALITAGDGARLYEPDRANAVFAALDPGRTFSYALGYPPPIYQLMATLQPTLSYFAVAKILLLANAAAHILAARLVVRATPALHPWRREAMAAAILLPAAFVNLMSGQLSGLWTLSMAGAVALWSAGRPRVAGLALAPLLLKPTLGGPVLLAFVLCGEGAVVGGMIGGGAILLSLSLAAGGAEAWGAWAQTMRDPEQLARDFLGFWRREVGLRTLFSTLAPDRSLIRSFGWVGMGLGAGLALGVAALARRVREASLSFGAVLAAVLLASPHLLDYDFGLYLPAMAAAAGWLLSGRARWPRTGAVLCGAAWLTGTARVLHGWSHTSLSTLAVLAWVLWLAAELRALAKARGAG